MADADQANQNFRFQKPKNGNSQIEIIDEAIENIENELSMYKYLFKWPNKIIRSLIYIAMIYVTFFDKDEKSKKLDSNMKVDPLSICDLILVIICFIESKCEKTRQKNIEFFKDTLVKSLKTNSQEIEAEYSRIIKFKFVTCVDYSFEIFRIACYIFSFVGSKFLDNFQVFDEFLKTDPIIKENFENFYKYKLNNTQMSETLLNHATSFFNAEGKDTIYQAISRLLVLMFVYDFPNLLFGESNIIIINRSFIKRLQILKNSFVDIEQ